MKVTKYKFSTDPPVKVPVVIFKGRRKGPTGFLSAGIHGDELNGMILVKKFIDDFRSNKLEKKMAGELIIMPVLNPTGFEKGQRRAEPDGRDLNRSFPGKRKGSFSFQFARELMRKFISKVDFGIDCHDAGTQSTLFPHSRIGRNDDKEAELAIRNLGRLFGTEIIIERRGKKGMLARAAFHKYGKPIVTVEIGGAKHIFDEFVKQGVTGIKNILKFYKMLPGEPSLPEKQFVLKSRFGIKAPRTGIIEFCVKLGDFVHAGDKIGVMYYPQVFKDEKLVSPMCGRVFSLHDHQIVKKGTIMYSILEKRKCHVDRTTLDKFEELGKLNVKKMKM